MKRSLTVVLFAAACATTSTPSTVKPEDMSAAAHREEAARERSRAEDAYARWQPGSRVPLPGAPAGSTDAPRMYPIDLYPYNPTDRALRDAERHVRHAREHEAAAVALEGFEDNECRDFAPKARAACPLLGPVMAIEDRANGVHFVLPSGAQVEAIVAHMRCHLAFARARAFADAGDCPLYMRGVEIAASADGHGIDVTSRDSAVVNDIQVKSRLSSTPQPGR
ncbi:MAG: hypothetical protein ACXVAN_07295 [Polyangia bacterium]